jgi:hypothetical protein
MPYLEIYMDMSASAHEVASMLGRGTASNHLVVLSIMVSRFVEPSAVTGRGPSENRLAGIWMGWTEAEGCEVTMPLLHSGSSSPSWLCLMPHHTTIAGWARPWMAAKIAAGQVLV